MIARARPAQFDEAVVGDEGRPLAPSQLTLADGPCQQRVTTGVAGQHEQVIAGGIGRPGA